MKLNKKKRYLQVSFNNSLLEAQKIIQELPSSDRVLIEVGTPLIIKYGMKALSFLRQYSVYYSSNGVSANRYLVADIKCADLADKEVRLASESGVSAATCLGIAPIETIENFIYQCRNHSLDSVIDMINVENPFLVLQKLRNSPDIVILHRGVDESRVSSEEVPYYQIGKIKGSYDVLVGVAGVDSLADIEKAFFNGADIVILWKAFFNYSKEGIDLINHLLKRIS